MFKELLSPSEKRQCLLIQLLKSSLEARYMSEYAKSLGCSVQTLNKDIKKINELCEHDLLYIHEGILLVYPHSINSMTSITYRIKCHSLAYKIVCHIIKSNNCILEDIANQLNSSISTISRTIRKINNFLKNKYRIEIQTNPIQFTGSEESIRILYLKLYILRLQAYGSEQINSQIHNLPVFINSLENILGKWSRSRLTEIDLYKIYINAQRASLNYNIPTTTPFSANILNDIDAPELVRLFSHHLPWATLEEPSFIIEQVLYSYLDNPEKEYDYQKKNTLKNALSQLALDFQINIQVDQIVSPLFKAINSIRNQTPIVYYDPKLSQDYAERFPQFYDKCLHIFSDTFSQKFNKIEFNYLFYTLVIHCNDLFQQLYEQSGKIKVLLISSYSKTYTKWLYNIFSMELSRQVEIEIFNKASLNTIEGNIDSFDFIISQITDPRIQHKRLIKIGTIPEIIDYQLCLQYIDDIRTQRLRQNRKE